MSLLWRDRICLVLGTRQVRWARLAAGLRLNVFATGSIPIPDDGQGDSALLSAAGHAIQAALQSRKTLRKPDCVVVLSIGATRCAMVPWSPALLSEGEHAALVSSCLQELLDNQETSWATRTLLGGYGNSSIAIGAKRELVALLRKQFDENRIRLRAIVPFLHSTLDRFRKASRIGGTGMVALMDDSGGIVGVACDAGWVSLRQSAWRWSMDELAVLRSREAALNGIEDDCPVQLIDFHFGEQPRNAHPEWLESIGATAIWNSMRAIDDQINFVERPRVSFGGTVSLCVATAATVAVLWHTWHVARALDDAQAVLFKLSSRSTTKQPAQSKESESRFLAEKAAALDVARSLSISWNDLLLTLEKIANDDVAVLSIQPEANLRVVNLSVEARDFAALMTYMRSMNGNSKIESPMLLSFQTQQQDAQRPIRARLTFAWTIEAAR